ncbi:2-dehydro-3-deoxygalactonokinase [Pseudooceanicola algae]|uniref:Putative 2-dehydro-3-deoxygalactonokinase DgoK1 n=1 Tax=Pseudooceanicola algae TaxID=1537215 RepID=A0A418SL67_9RHOB|nr:2-dehydro-3-deoxygalactonokinase [Pseudooceanicola algae]QPM90851.1 putative 2-dehydro-3-deoxygalactonokinase DgoK1 [Pseudooceanicola algae]
MQQASWIAVDWGTSNLRLWAIGPEGQVLAERSSADGMGGLEPDRFEPALLALAGDLLAPERKTDVLICGMAGARQGWVEAPYAAVPCAPAGGAPTPAPARDSRLSVRILPGLSQAGPADVMRGEETQIAGFLAGHPDFNGTLCLPGTHTKWVRVADGRITRFRTAMTGELFALLSTASVLRHSVSIEGFSEAAFLDGFDQAAASPLTLALDLFSIRPASLLADTAPEASRARLSGLLIGAELASVRDFWDGCPVVVIGTAALSQRYREGLHRLGAEAAISDHPALALEGLRAAHARFAKEKT